MVPPRHHPGAGRPGALSSSPPFRLRSAKFSGIALQDLRKAFKIRLQMVCVFIMNRMNSQSSGFTQRKRMALGIVILLLVDVIWVASSELTSYVFTQYNKPFFSTFAKTSMFVLYLLGFIVWKPWRQQCTKGFRGKHATFLADAEGYFAACTTDTTMNSSLSEPLYVPVKFHDLPSEKPENTSIDTEKIVMYGCESWTKKKAECERTEAFELWCWRRLLRILWTARRSNQLILKGISPEYSLEGLVLKLKLQYFGHLMRRTNSLEKTLMLGKVEGRGEEGHRGQDGWMASPINWT